MRDHRRKQQPRNRLLNHGLLAIQREQLLSTPLAAQRPKTCAAASSEDHGIKLWNRSHVDVRISSNCLFRQSDAAQPAASANLTLRARVNLPLRLAASSEVADYLLVTGSGSESPGTASLISSSSHCGRTRKLDMQAGTTTASPLAKVTGSAPGASQIPQPSTATIICTELLPR